MLRAKPVPDPFVQLGQLTEPIGAERLFIIRFPGCIRGTRNVCPKLNYL